MYDELTLVRALAGFLLTNDKAGYDQLLGLLKKDGLDTGKLVRKAKA